jgi:putative FmdB family regulatory protein
MPLYEYRCAACRKEFEELVFGDDVPACPHCGGAKADRLMSRAAFRVSGGDASPTSASSGGGGCAGCSGGNCATCR